MSFVPLLSPLYRTVGTTVSSTYGTQQRQDNLLILLKTFRLLSPAAVGGGIYIDICLCDELSSEMQIQSCHAVNCDNDWLTVVTTDDAIRYNKTETVP